MPTTTITSTLIDEEQRWQDEGWRFKGWIFNFRSTKGTGSSFTSNVDFFNMKLHAGRLESTATTNREVLPQSGQAAKRTTFIFEVRT